MPLQGDPFELVEVKPDGTPIFRLREQPTAIDPLFEVGDTIEFETIGQYSHTVSGRIQTVGKHGYWIASTSGAVGSGSIRCDFDRARLIRKA